MTDQQYDICIEEICSGKKEGLKRIYEAYMPYIYRLIMEILKNKEDAEDVTSEFFIRIWNTAEQYQKGRGHKAYISSIARNMCIDFLRKKNREIPVDLSGESEQEENEARSRSRQEEFTAGKSSEEYTEDFSNRVVENMTLKQVMTFLTDVEREILYLKFSGGFKFREIAEIQRRPIGTVTWSYQSAIRKLKRYGYE